MKKLKEKGNLILRICLTGMIILLIITTFLAITLKELNQNTQLITTISLIMVLLNIPGIIDQLAKEFNPKKKEYKLSCKCPKCKHLIQMDMKEK